MFVYIAWTEGLRQLNACIGIPLNKGDVLKRLDFVLQNRVDSSCDNVQHGLLKEKKVHYVNVAVTLVRELFSASLKANYAQGLVTIANAPTWYISLIRLSISIALEVENAKTAFSVRQRGGSFSEATLKHR